MDSLELTKSQGRRICLIDEQVIIGQEKYLKKFPRTERFGLGLGIKRKRANIILATIWPKQESNSPVFTSIRIEDLGLIFPFIQDIKDKHSVRDPFGIVAWVHTHPHLGLFLSGTDVETIQNWSLVIQDVIAVVFDIFGKPEDQWRAFLSNKEPLPSRRMKYPIRGELKEFCHDLCRELPVYMKSAGRPLESLFTPIGSYIQDGDSAPINLSIEQTGFRLTAEKRPLGMDLPGLLKDTMVSLHNKIKLKRVPGLSHASIGIPTAQAPDVLRDAAQKRMESKKVWFIPAPPAADVCIRSASGLPSELKEPLLKADEGEITGYRSGQRSALILLETEKDKTTCYRLKGCGFEQKGIHILESTYHDGVQYREVRGTQYPHLSERELLMTRFVNLAFSKRGIPPANIPLGWWEYKTTLPVATSCGLFFTQGEFRLRDDLLYSMESMLPKLFRGRVPVPISLEILSQKPAYSCLMESRHPVDYRGWTLVPDNLDDTHWTSYNSGNRQILEVLINKLQRSIPSIPEIYWVLGCQSGYIKRVIEDASIIWGTYFDNRQNVWHCNSHADNLVLVAESEMAALSGLDFDLAFDRSGFISPVGRDHSFDSLIRIENWWLKLDLAGCPFESFTQTRWAHLEDPWDQIRNGLRETLLAGYEKGYHEGYQAPLTNQMVIFLILCLLGLGQLERKSRIT
jgi:proteasome lid subunit RPN8/RPN11